MLSRNDFRARLLEVRPDLAERVRDNEVKRKLALALRALRKERGLTQREIEARSGLAQSMISRLEAPSGPMPKWETIMRYVRACDGHMLLGFSLEAFDEEAFLQPSNDTGNEKVVSAVSLG
ncbi:MAG: helix-turn-helix domain-containing protein [Geminicoccaceae bacterium]|nr:helix-turn-helix domain-containing protein [Geminicoccaceae bacterium]